MLMVDNLAFSKHETMKSLFFLQYTGLFAKLIKDGAYYCYCAYVLRIARYSGFLWVVPINTGIFLRGLKLYEGSRTYQMPLVSQKKSGGNHAFFREN